MKTQKFSIVRLICRSIKVNYESISKSCFIHVLIFRCTLCSFLVVANTDVGLDLFKHVVDQLLNLLPGSRQQLLQVQWSIVDNELNQKVLFNFTIVIKKQKTKNKPKRESPRLSRKSSRSSIISTSSQSDDDEQSLNGDSNENYFVIKTSDLYTSLPSVLRWRRHKPKHIIIHMIKLWKSEFSIYFPHHLFMYMIANDLNTDGTPVLQVNSFQGET